MKKSTLLICCGVLLTLIIIACQKQQNIVQPKTIKQKEAAKLNLSINQPAEGCRIATEKAKLFMDRFHEQEETKLGTATDYVVGYKMPAMGILDILREAEGQGMKLTYIYTYKGINDDGRETLVYGGMDETENQILYWPKTTENWHEPVLEDVVGDITKNDPTISNILNGQKQEDIAQPKTIKQETARINLSINQPAAVCRISMEKAKSFIERFRKQQEAKLGTASNYVVGYKIPAMGILDILREAEEQSIKLAYIYTYKGINDAGRETLIYGGMDETGKDILSWPKNTANWHQPVLEDIAGEITKNDVTIFNILK